MGLGQVVPVIGVGAGYPGEPSRTGGGEPFIVSKQANPNNSANINFGDTVVLLPDTEGGSYRQFADFLAHGGNTLTTVTGTSGQTTITVGSATGITPGMFLFGTGIAVGAQVVSLSGTTVTVSIANSGTVSGNLSVAWFGGIAVRQVKTQLTYPYTPGTQLSGDYLPGQMCGVEVRGSISVLCNVGTPLAGAPVYLRIALNSGVPAGLVGDLEAASDTTYTILIPGLQWKTGLLGSSSYVTELTILERLTA